MELSLPAPGARGRYAPGWSTATGPRRTPSRGSRALAPCGSARVLGSQRRAPPRVTLSQSLLSLSWRFEIWTGGGRGRRGRAVQTPSVYPQRGRRLKLVTRVLEVSVSNFNIGCGKKSPTRRCYPFGAGVSGSIFDNTAFIWPPAKKPSK